MQIDIKQTKGVRNTTLAIRADKEALVEEAYCDVFEYADTVKDETGEVVPNPETKAAFVARQIEEQLKDCIAKTIRARAQKAFVKQRKETMGPVRRQIRDNTQAEVDALWQ